MKVCDRLLKLGDNPNPIHFHYCEACGGLHVSHLGFEESVLFYDGDEPINIRQLQGLT